MGRCTTYSIPPERLLVVSRGGTASWYGDIAARYVDAFEFFSPDEFRAATAEAQEAAPRRRVRCRDLVERVDLDAPARAAGAAASRADVPAVHAVLEGPRDDCAGGASTRRTRASRRRTIRCSTRSSGATTWRRASTSASAFPTRRRTARSCRRRSTASAARRRSCCSIRRSPSTIIVTLDAAGGRVHTVGAQHGAAAESGRADRRHRARARVRRDLRRLLVSRAVLRRAVAGVLFRAARSRRITCRWRSTSSRGSAAPPSCR